MSDYREVHEQARCSCQMPDDPNCPQHGDCSYCGGTGWVWVNAVECTHCARGRELAGRGNVQMSGGLDTTIQPVEVPDGE